MSSVQGALVEVRVDVPEELPVPGEFAPFAPLPVPDELAPFVAPDEFTPFAPVPVPGEFTPFAPLAALPLAPVPVLPFAPVPVPSLYLYRSPPLPNRCLQQRQLRPLGQKPVGRRREWRELQCLKSVSQFVPRLFLSLFLYPKMKAPEAAYTPGEENSLMAFSTASRVSPVRF